MNPQLTAWIAAFGLGLLGAVLGAWWLSQLLRTQWASEVQSVLQAQLDAHARTQLQALRDALPAPADAVPAHVAVQTGAPAAPPADAVLSDLALQRVAERVQSLLAAHLPTVVAGALVDATAASQHAAAEQARALHDALLQALQHAQQQVQAHIGETVHASAKHQTQQLQAQVQSLQARMEGGLRDLRQAMATAPPSVLPLAAVPQATPVLDTAPLAEQLQSQLAAAFDAQREALQQARQQAEDTLQQSLRRVPQWVQQAIQVELEFQTQQQAERDTARAVEQQRWQAEQDERRAAELRVLLQALSAQPVATVPPVASPPPEPPRPRVPAPGAPVRPPAAVSARPPELELTPLPRPEPLQESEVAAPELSDEELDALPPDLPAPDKARKRILPPPKKPPLRSL